MEIVLSQFRNMHKAFDVYLVERDKNTKTGHAADGSREFLAEAVLHVVALQPRIDIAGSLVGAAFGRGTLHPQLIPGLLGVVRGSREERLDGAVRQQIGISANRRGEMRVGIVGKAKVADIVGAVHRLFHRAQQHCLQQRRVGTVLDFFQQCRIVGRLRLISSRQLQSEILQHRSQRFQLLLIRAGMDAIQRGMLILQQVFRRADIGRQHAFLDKPMRIVAQRWHNLLDLADVVEYHHGLGRVEIDGATLVARRQQHLEHGIELAQIRQQVFLDTVIGLKRIERLGHVGIGQPGGGMKHRFHELITLDLAGSGNRHFAHQRQAIDVRFQRAHFIGQRFRQHRDHAPREVHGIAAIARLKIECIAVFHIVRHVGDRHQQAKALALFFAEHRIVEIPRGLAIYRDEGVITQILASLDVGRRDFFRYLLFQRLNLSWPEVRQIVFAKRNLDFHSRIGVVAQHFDHARHRLRIPGGLGNQFHHDHLPRLGTAIESRLDQDVLIDALVFGHHE